MLLCLLIFLYCILLFIIFISSTRRRGTICVAETSPQTGLTLAMMLSWGKACSTVPSGPLPPPPLTYQLGRILGGWGQRGDRPPPPHIPPPPLNCKKSIWNHHFMTYVFKNKYFTNIFVKGMWFHIFGTWKVKSNTYTIDLNLKFTCLTTNPPPPLSINGLAQGQWGGVGLPPPPHLNPPAYQNSN